MKTRIAGRQVRVNEHVWVCRADALRAAARGERSPDVVPGDADEAQKKPVFAEAWFAHTLDALDWIGGAPRKGEWVTDGPAAACETTILEPEPGVRQCYWWTCTCGDEGGPHDSYNEAWDAHGVPVLHAAHPTGESQR